MQEFGTAFERLFQSITDYNVVVIPLAAFLLVAILGSRVFSSSGVSNGNRARRPGLLHRAASLFVDAFTTNWQLTLLATSAFVLSLAAGWNAWNGMRNFTGERVLSLMITFGIQSVMLIIAWLIGESFAAGMNQRTEGARTRSTASWVVGMIVGVLFGVAFLAAIASAIGLFDMPNLALSSFSWNALGDKAIYVAAGLLLLAVVLLNSQSDIVQPYVQSARIIAKNAILWVMFLCCMSTSVFFGFDSLFTSIFPASERERAAEIRAVNQVAAVVADIGVLTQRRQAEEADRLFQSEGWKAYEANLLRLSQQSLGADSDIEKYFEDQMEARRRAINEQQERITTSQSGQIALQAKKATLTDELSRMKGERPAIVSELADKKTELENRAKSIDEKRVEAMAEERGAEGTLKVGKGPMYRERVGELNRMMDAYKIQEERVRDAQKRLGSADARIAQIERELAGLDGELAKMKGEAQTAESRIKAAEQSRTGEEGPKADPARVRSAFERARADFRQEPTLERLNALTAQCTQLYGAMIATPATKDKVRDVDCDPKQASEAAGHVFALNAGLENFAHNCAGGDRLPQTGGTGALLSFGRKCLQDSGLSSRDTSMFGAKLANVDLNRDDKAHRFVVTWNAFQDGNRLAYLALGIAIAIDSLVFMSALFGANAVRSPLSDLKGRSDLTADQLEAAIDAALKTTPDPRATLVTLLRSMHPVSQGDDGFTSEIILDPREPLADDMRTVVVAGATIGAVRRVGADRSRYLVSTGLARYFAVAQRKSWPVRTKDAERKELVNVIGVALLPDPQTNAEIVLSELHPISDAPGYAAETYPFRIEDRATQRLVLNTLGAGATVAGAVQRFHKDSGRYFVSTDFYKTLLMMRAAAFPQFSGPQPETRKLRSEAAHPRQEAIEDRTPPQLEAPRSERILSRLGTPPPPESGMGDDIRAELIQLAGLHPWNARELGSARSLSDKSEVEQALKRLSSQAPVLGQRVDDAIEDYRSSVQAAYEHLRTHHHHDAVYLQVLETVAGELQDLMPQLMLTPGGPYQQILERIVYDFEPHDGEGTLSPKDKLVLTRVRQQLEYLKAVPDAPAGRDSRIARILDKYDERSTSTQAPGSDNEGGERRTLN